MRKVLYVLIAIMFSFGLISVNLPETTSAYAEGPSARYFELRTNSLTASAPGVSIAEQTGAEIVSVGGSENAIQLGSGDSIVFEFDLADDCVGGLIKTVGYNIGTSSSTAIVGIYIEGYAENDGYYTLSASGSEGIGQGVYTMSSYGFGNSSWYNSASKIIRVKISGTRDDSPVKLTNISVSDSAVDVIDDAISLTPLSGETGKLNYIGGSVDLYFDNGIPTYHLVGPVICEFFVNAAATSITPELVALNNGAVVVRNAGGIDGTPSNYTSTVQSGVPIDISGYAVEGSGSNTYKRIVLMMYGGTNNFVKSLSFTLDYDISFGASDYYYGEYEAEDNALSGEALIIFAQTQNPTVNEFGIIVTYGGNDYRFAGTRLGADGKFGIALFGIPDTELSVRVYVDDKVSDYTLTFTRP